jgi:hypothetical protein
MVRRKRKSTPTTKSRRKSQAETRAERLTWVSLLLIFAFLTIVNDNFARQAELIPNSFVPLSGAIVLIGSGLFQFTNGWQVSPITWFMGFILLLLGFINVLIDPTLDLTGLSLLAFSAVILAGVITGET